MNIPSERIIRLIQNDVQSLLHAPHPLNKLDDIRLRQRPPKSLPNIRMRRPGLKLLFHLTNQALQLLDDAMGVKKRFQLRRKMFLVENLSIGSDLRLQSRDGNPQVRQLLQ
jgi:hypothetical protein